MDAIFLGPRTAVILAIVAVLIALAVLGLMIFQTILLRRLLREVFLARVVPELRRLNREPEAQRKLEYELEHRTTDRACRTDAHLLWRHDANGLAKAA